MEIKASRFNGEAPPIGIREISLYDLLSGGGKDGPRCQSMSFSDVIDVGPGVGRAHRLRDV